MTTGPCIPAELSWLDDGHVSDVVLTAMADGEEAVVLPAARDHVAACEACSARLAEAALLTLRASELLGSGALEVPARSKPRAAVPLRAIAVALMLAAIGAVPLFVDAVTGLPATSAMVTRALPILARSAVVLLRHGSVGLERATTLVSWLTAGIAVVVGFLIARAGRRAARGQSSVQGGV